MPLPFAKTLFGLGAVLLGALMLLGFKMESAQAFEEDCKKFSSDTLRAMAQELIEQDLAGARLPEKSPCLKALKPKFTVVSHDPVQMDFDRVEWVGDEVQVRVLSVEPLLLGKKPEGAKATFEVGLAGNWYRDEIRFNLNQSPSVQRQEGCGGVMEYPKHWRVKKSCAGGSGALQK